MPVPSNSELIRHASRQPSLSQEDFGVLHCTALYRVVSTNGFQRCSVSERTVHAGINYYILVYTSMYQHMPINKYIPVHTSVYQYIPVCTSMSWYVRVNTKIKFSRRHTVFYTRSARLCCGVTLTTLRVNPQRYVPVYTSTYQYKLVHTGMY